LDYFFFLDESLFASGFSSSKYKGSTYVPKGGALQEERKIPEKISMVIILLNIFILVKLHLKSSFKK
tara:strand:+ start:91 stop:291 length:201 start_codon:yes stop_codon:yes gene_type:complete